MSGDKKRILEYENIIKTEAAIEYLEQILTGLKSGKITLASGASGVELTPTEVTKFTVEIKDSGFSRTLKLKMKWKDEGQGPMPSTDPLQIS